MQSNQQNNNHTNNQASFTRENAIWMLIVPQIIILVISTVWILIFPNDNILKFLTVKPILILYGLGIAFLLAFSGFGFYKFAKVFQEKNKMFANLVFYFENALSPVIKLLNPLDIFLVSSISGFCEEVFFRGLLTIKCGIIVSSLIFGFLHIPSGKDGKVWIYAIWATLSGAFLAYLFLYFNNLWITIVAHIVNNIIGMFLLQSLKTNN